MTAVDRIELENIMYRRAYDLAKLTESEFLSRFEEGRWLLKKFMETIERQEKDRMKL